MEAESEFPDSGNQCCAGSLQFTMAAGIHDSPAASPTGSGAATPGGSGASSPRSHRGAEAAATGQASPRRLKAMLSKVLHQRSYSSGSSVAAEGVELTELHGQHDAHQQSQRHHHSRLADQHAAEAAECHAHSEDASL